MHDTIQRIGFCCKYISRDAQISGFGPRDAERQYSQRTITLTRARSLAPAAAEAKLWELTRENTAALGRFVRLVAGFTPQRRMARLGSDVLPLYTHPEFSAFYRRADVRSYLERSLSETGQVARTAGVRLSFHPGQFCVLASDRPAAVDSSIAEMEYHADLARWLGYGNSFHDHGFKINVHISGRRGPDGVRAVLPRLSTTARNLITIENEEHAYGLDAALSLADVLPIVLDTHHHWIHTGQYLPHTDDAVRRIIDSWRGVRPALHYSISRETVLPGHPTDQLPNYATLTAAGHNSCSLRAHSDYYWNAAANDYILGFWDRFDIQCESKAKNLASERLYAWAQRRSQAAGEQPPVTAVADCSRTV